MGSYKLLEQLTPKYEVCYKPFVYNNPTFLKSNNNFDQRHFYWVNETENKAHAHIAFSIENNTAFSPRKSPFGGLEVSTELTQEEIGNFLEAIESKLQESGITELRIHQAPSAYADQTNCNEALTLQGFELIQNRIFHSIEVDDRDLVGRMHKMEQRKIKKCLDAGGEFRELKKGEKVEAFKVIDRFRTIADKPASMKWVDLERADQLNPKVFLAFGIFMDGHMIAGTTAVMVNNESLYHFMPAQMTNFSEHKQYKQYSPMVMLVNSMYQWCQSREIKLLDLGTSYVDLKLKTSLVEFKENIGGKACEALSWQKTLSS